VRSEKRNTPLLVVALLCLGSSAYAGARVAQSPAIPELPLIVPDHFPAPVREKVREAFTAALSAPLDAEANGRLGMILQAYQAADHRAELCYERAHRLDPKSFRWSYYLGSVQAARGRHAEAVRTLQEALRLEPDYLPALLKLGDSLLASGQAEEALQRFRAAVLQEPSSAQAYYGLGRAQSATKDVTGAVASLRRACDLFPYFGAAHYALALAYKRLGKTEEAQREFALYEKNKYDIPGTADRFQAELNALYTSPAYLLELGVDLDRQGKLAEAAAEHEKALAIDPQLIRAHINLISLYGRLRQFEKAEAHYRAAVGLDPNSVESHYNYGVLLMHQGKYAQAEGPLHRTLQIDPNHPEAHFNLGDSLQRQGKLRAAAEEFRKAAQNRPGFSEAHFNLGRLLVNQEEFDAGIKELLKALETAGPEIKPMYLYAVGAAYARAGNRPDALKYLRMAREKAVARGQGTLREKIDRDLEQLQSGDIPK